MKEINWDEKAYEEVSWKATPYKLTNGKWAPKAIIYEDHKHYIREIPVKMDDNLLFDNEEEAKMHSELTVKKQIEKKYSDANK